MAVLKLKSEIECSDFNEFCDLFEINSEFVAGENGTDEELILEELNKIKDTKFVLTFFDNKNGGYFKIQTY
jgi:hypothetical protein